MIYHSKNDYILCHHNDGKGKWKSHEVYSKRFLEIPSGYGETKEEAFQEFVKKFNEYADQLVKFFREDLKIENAVVVDWKGDKVK